MALRTEETAARNIAFALACVACMIEREREHARMLRKLAQQLGILRSMNATYAARILHGVADEIERTGHV